jgi:hypothetical protein
MFWQEFCLAPSSVFRFQRASFSFADGQTP